MSSREGIPVDVVMVELEPGEMRVPEGGGGWVEDALLLKEDMVVSARSKSD